MGCRWKRLTCASESQNDFFFNNHQQLSHQSHSISITLVPITLFTRLSWLLFKWELFIKWFACERHILGGHSSITWSDFISAIICDSWATHINLFNKCARDKILWIYLFILQWFSRRLLLLLMYTPDLPFITQKQCKQSLLDETQQLKKVLMCCYDYKP